MDPIPSGPTASTLSPIVNSQPMLQQQMPPPQYNAPPSTPPAQMMQQPSYPIQQNQNSYRPPLINQYQPINTSSSPAQNRPTNINDLNYKCSSPAGRQDLLTQNLVFYSTIMAAIAVKNKLDYPPTGPINQPSLQTQNNKLVQMLNSINALIQNPLFMSSSMFYSTIITAISAKNQLDYPRGMTQQDQAFQGAKLKCLFDAIVEKRTSATGAPVQFPLAQHGAMQQGALNTRASSSKMLGIGRGIFGRGGWFGNGGSMKNRKSSKKNTNRRRRY